MSKDRKDALTFTIKCASGWFW